MDNYPLKRYVRYWGNKLPPKRRLAGFMRWKMANSLKKGALSLPHISAANSFSGFEKLSDSLWLTTPQYSRWTNRSFLTRKHFFLESLIPFAEQHPTSRRVNGTPDLEHPINCSNNRSWWRSQSFSIGISVPGLFGHYRHDRTPDDEKGCS